MVTSRRHIPQKIAALVLAATLVGMTGCSSGKTGGTKSSSKINTSNLNAKGTTPILKNKVSLTVLIPQDTNIPDFKTNDMTKKIEQNVNVDLQFQYLPTGNDAQQKFAVMISSGSKLPDLVIGTFLNSVQANVYGQQGYFIALNDLTDKVSINLKPHLDSKDGKAYSPYIYDSNGKMYGFPRVVEDLGNDWSWRYWINQTWLKKLGLSMPKTTDDLYTALKAFKTQDPNGNGKADEIPLIGSKDSWNGMPWRTLMNAFIYVNSAYDYWDVSNGKLSCSYIQPEFLEGLKYMNKLCSEGLLSPLSFTQDQNQEKQILENKDAQIVGSLPAGSMSIYQVASKRKEDMASVPPLTGPKGVCWTQAFDSGSPTPAGYITKDCKDPVAAYMAFDYLYQTDLVWQGRFGIKGVDWKSPDAGAKGLYESLGYQPKIQYINSIWGTIQNHEWGENNPTWRTADMIGGQVWNNNPYDSQYMTAQAVPLYKGKAPKETVKSIVYTADEMNQIASIKSTLDTYRDQAVAAFITGSRPLSDWDNYVKEINNIGLPTFQKVAQKAYDRMKSQK